MPVTQLADVIVPAEFTAYQVENSFVSTAFFQSGVAVPNGLIEAQLHAGSEQFTIPVWTDLGEMEPNYSTDNPAQLSTPNKIGSYPINVRKTQANQSWGTMDLASELSGSDPLQRIRDRVQEYWNRTWERRLLASLTGVLYSNVANNAGDMVNDISSQTGTAANFSATAVIQTAETLGDRLEDVKTIAMHSHIYTQALINDEIQFLPSSLGQPIKTYRGMAVVIDDGLTPSPGIYLSILFGASSVAYGVSEPRLSLGTELFRVPAAGNGGGETQLYSRMACAIQPAGFSWTDGTGLAGLSPSLAELSTASHWNRVAQSRKSIPLAFLISR